MHSHVRTISNKIATQSLNALVVWKSLCRTYIDTQPPTALSHLFLPLQHQYIDLARMFCPQEGQNTVQPLASFQDTLNNYFDNPITHPQDPLFDRLKAFLACWPNNFYGLNRHILAVVKTPFSTITSCYLSETDLLALLAAIDCPGDTHRFIQCTNLARIFIERFNDDQLTIIIKKIDEVLCSENTLIHDVCYDMLNTISVVKPKQDLTPVINTLVTDLTTPKSATKYLAITALTKIKLNFRHLQSVTPVLIALLQDTDPTIRVAASNAIKINSALMLDTPKLVDDIVHLASSENPELRAEAARILGNIYKCPNYILVINTLTELLNDESESVKLNALYSLVEVATTLTIPTKISNALMAKLDDPQLKILIINAFGESFYENKFDNEMIYALLRLANDDTCVKEAVIKTLSLFFVYINSETEKNKIVTLIQEKLNDPSDSVRKAAIQASVKIECDSDFADIIICGLINRYKIEIVPNVTSELSMAIGYFAIRFSRFKFQSFIDENLIANEFDMPSVKIEKNSILPNNPNLMKILTDKLQHDSAKVRVEAATLIAKISSLNHSTQFLHILSRMILQEPEDRLAAIQLFSIIPLHFNSHQRSGIIDEILERTYEQLDQKSIMIRAAALTTLSIIAQPEDNIESIATAIFYNLKDGRLELVEPAIACLNKIFPFFKEHTHLETQYTFQFAQALLIKLNQTLDQQTRLTIIKSLMLFSMQLQGCSIIHMLLTHINPEVRRDGMNEIIAAEKEMDAGDVGDLVLGVLYNRLVHTYDQMDRFCYIETIEKIRQQRFAPIYNNIKIPLSGLEKVLPIKFH
jgi:HEAT repeat protein